MDLIQWFEIYQPMLIPTSLSSPLNTLFFNWSYNIYLLILTCFGMLHFFSNFSSDLCLDYFIPSIISDLIVPYHIEKTVCQFQADVT